jgi:hypothetical protein
MSDVALAPAGIASDASEAARPRTGWFGRFLALALAAALAALKLVEFGDENGWSYSLVVPFVHDVDWHQQWKAITVIALEGVASAAAISIAFSLYVSNTFTTNVSSKIVKNVRNALNRETRENISAINTNVTELRSDVDAFRQLLEKRGDDQIQELERFLAYAHGKRVTDLSGQLQTDDVLFLRLADALEEWKKSRAGGGGT